MSEKVIDQHRPGGKYHSGILGAAHNQGNICQVTPKYIWENGGGRAGPGVIHGRLASRGGEGAPKERSDKTNGERFGGSFSGNYFLEIEPRRDQGAKARPLILEYPICLPFLNRYTLLACRT